MTNTTSSKEWMHTLRWLQIDIARECDRAEPSHGVLCTMRMQHATFTWALKEALQREAREATLLSIWTEIVADRAALCGF